MDARAETVLPRRPHRDEVGRFLAALHGDAVDDLEQLHGGFWSAAYGYRVGDRALVLRIGQHRSWFEMDRDAMAYNAPGSPVPEVLEIGDAFGGAYAISVRHYGRFLETVAQDEADVVGPTIVRLLTALKAAPSAATPASWRDWLMRGLVDHPDQPQSGWRAKIASDRSLDSLFRMCGSRVEELSASCPERRDLVHGDLLHSNVLINDDASRVNAVFSWKCSTRGDFLYDVAWCTFWSSFHPGIAAADVFHRVVDDASIAADPGALDGAAERHHCYELHIGASHLGWNLWVGDEQALRAVAARTSEILARGPVTVENQVGL
jgi:aminoglycoside phosphotransferase (APT) family kinase protein